MVWERFVRSAPGDVGKQHRVHPGVAVVRFPLGHSEPSLASTSLRQSDGASRCTSEKNSDRKRDCPGCTQSGHNLAQPRRLAATFSPLRVEVIPCTSCFGRDVDRIAFALELALVLIHLSNSDSKKRQCRRVPSLNEYAGTRLSRARRIKVLA